MTFDSEAYADVIAEAIRVATKPLAARIGDLERRCKSLESAPRGLKYLGTWREDDGPYSPGDVVTHGGGMWCCMEGTRSRPGESRAWQLAVKSGGR